MRDVCPICHKEADLVWDHCHDCGEFRAYICGGCNTALTEHMIPVWDEAGAYIRRHACRPSLFDIPRQASSKPAQRGTTSRLYMGQGRADRRYIRMSTVPDHKTAEQTGAALGITPGTARDRFKGRHSAATGTLLIPTTWLIDQLRSQSQ